MKVLKIGRFALTASVILTLASCNRNEYIVKRLTPEQKEAFAQNIYGEYPGKYLILYTNKECKENEAYEEIVTNAQVDVSNYWMSHVFFQDFPVSLISKVVDADEALSQALAKADPLAICARYSFQYDTDNSNIIWSYSPNEMLLKLNYNGEDHNILVEFDNAHRYYKATEDELKQPNAFNHLTKACLSLRLKAIYDGHKLIQDFISGNGNEMDILFKTTKEKI